MMAKFKLRLTEIALGRVLLHLVCLLRDGHGNFPCAGIRCGLSKEG